MKVIKKLVNSKATEIFGIPNRALKDCAENITDIFNFSLETEVFPDDLKVGKVAPVYKSGDKDDLNNYRPISVLPTVATVFEKVLYGQIYDHFTSNKLLGNQQFGFRTLHSTALALSECTSNWWLKIHKLQTLQNKAARTIAKLRYDEANHYELLTEFGWLSVRNLTSLDTVAIFV